MQRFHSSRASFFLAAMLMTAVNANGENNNQLNDRLCIKHISPSGNMTTNLNNLKTAVNDAQQFFNTKNCRHIRKHNDQSGYRFMVMLPKGRLPVGDGLKFDNFNAGTGNRLQFQGKSMDDTVLVFPVGAISLSGTNANGILWQDIHFTKDKLTVTQGRIISSFNSAAGEPIIDFTLDPGYPGLAPAPNGIMNPDNEFGRAVMRINDFRDQNNRRVAVYERYAQHPAGYPWIRARSVDAAGTRWFVTLRKRPTVNGEPIGVDPIRFFNTGRKIAIKSKHGGQAYRFVYGRNLWFHKIRWTRETRGVFRGVGSIRVRDSIAEPDRCLDTYSGYRSNPRACNRPGFSYLASHSGGVQIGQPVDNPFSIPSTKRLAAHGGAYHNVSNNIFIRLGDDPIGLFNLRGRTVVSNNRITGGTARGIYHLDVCGHFGIAAPAVLNLGNTCTNCGQPYYHTTEFHHQVNLKASFAENREAWCLNWERQMAR